MATSDPIDYDLLAWDISDAIAKSVNPDVLDVDSDNIRPALLAFIAAIRVNSGRNTSQREHQT
jgi:hypothetical protein